MLFCEKRHWMCAKSNGLTKFCHNLNSVNTKNVNFALIFVQMRRIDIAL